ncbi:hypothetical protein BGZ96_005155 [Linnemannia gamsii]|uniref:Protein-serine/threonine kinase n=1 Tax=Linnemannia gamsii TaxID=64522 RepID=A0ABQ7KHR5_9FUNG|nr:hypothetical protein BGZ96_005155 [Linnemannia gamsii]
MTRRTGGGPGRRGVHQQISTQQELDNVVSFYDDQITLYADQEIQTVTLKALLGFGRAKTAGAEAMTGSAVKVDGNDHRYQQDLEVNLEMARYARKELPVRLARRVKSIQNLPFIIGTNPYIKRVYRLYYDAFQALTAFQEDIRDIEDLDRFAEVLQGLVESHADVIPMLSQGFLECKKYMNTSDIQTFLDEMIRSRIGIRLIAEQVISLRAQRTDLLKDNDDNEKSTQDNNKYNSTITTPSIADPLVVNCQVIGVVHTQLKPAELIKDCASFVQELCNVNYGSSPDVVINGQTDATFTYVPVHLEYILCELLKNSLRATVEHSVKIGRSIPRRATNFFDEPSEDEGLIGHAKVREVPQDNSNGGPVNAREKEGEEVDITKRMNEYGHPPVEVTIAQSEHEITIRIRDQGGGVSKEDLDHIFDYSFTTVKDENESSSSSSSSAAADGGLLDGGSPGNESESIFKGVSRLAMQAGLGGPIAGLGFGLPLTRIYAQYFGGRMHLVSLQGHGVDVYLKLRQLELVEDLQI